MHPLIRLAIEALNRDAVEVTIVRDGQGNVLSVQTKHRKSPNRARTLHSLLNAIRPLIKLEQERAGQSPPYDLDGTVPSAAGTGPTGAHSGAISPLQPPRTGRYIQTSCLNKVTSIRRRLRAAQAVKWMIVQKTAPPSRST